MNFRHIILIFIFYHLFLLKFASLQDTDDEGELDSEAVGSPSNDDQYQDNKDVVDNPDDDDEINFATENDGNEALREKYTKKTKKVRKTPVYVPVPTKKHKNKDKIISVVPGMYIAGGQPLYGKFKTLKGCAKACSKVPTCFAADYDQHLHKCYLHTNVTACARRLAHPSLTHLSKVPCHSSDLPTSVGSRVILGTQMYYGYEQKGVDDLKTCMKKCLTLGGGLASSPLTILTTPQLCVAINFDFSTHKCYFFPQFVNGVFNLCAVSDDSGIMYTLRKNSRLLVANPFVVSIFLCPTGTRNAEGR